MQDFQTDLTNCDREPIHIPGHIQSHGFMIVVDENFFIRYYSENLFEFVPDAPTNLLGSNIQIMTPFTKEVNGSDFSLSQLISFGKK